MRLHCYVTIMSKLCQIQLSPLGMILINVIIFFEDAPDETTLTTVPSNRTLLRGSIMTLNCQTVTSPEAEYHFYFNGKFIGNSSTGVLRVSVKEDGDYTCVPTNTVSTGDNATVSITVVGKLLYPSAYCSHVY